MTGRSVLDEPHTPPTRPPTPSFASGRGSSRATRWGWSCSRPIASSTRRSGCSTGRSFDRACWLARGVPGRRAPRRHRSARRRVRAGGDGALAGRDRRGDRAPALDAAGAAAVSARARRDLHHLLRRAALPTAARDAGVPVRGPGARRGRGPGARARASIARRPRPFGARVGAGAGADRGLAPRVAGAAGRRSRVAGAHRWAATEAAFQVGPESGTRLLLWRPTTPFSGTSPIDGAPNGLHLTTGSDGSARSRVRLGGGALFPGDYVVG